MFNKPKLDDDEDEEIVNEVDCVQLACLFYKPIFDTYIRLIIQNIKKDKLEKVWFDITEI